MKKGVGLLILMLFIFPLASAATSQITIHTLPLHEVSVFILDPGEKYESLQSFPLRRTGFDGTVSFNATVEKSSFGLFVIIKKDGENIFSDRLDNQNLAAFIDIYLLVNESDDFLSSSTQVEETSGTSTETEELDVNTAEGLTGSVVAEEGSNFSRIIYIIVGVLLLVGIATFVIIKKNYLNHPLFKTDNKPPTVLVDSELEDAEKRIQEAEKEIKDIRSKSSKRMVAQQKFLEAKKDLEEAEKSFGVTQDEPNEENEEEK